MFDRLTGEDDTAKTGVIGARLDGILAWFGRLQALTTAPGTVEMPRIGEVR